MNTTDIMLVTAGAPLAVVFLSHLIVHLFALVKLPKEAAFVARYTPTVTALLPAIEDQVLGGPNLVTLVADLDKAAKAEPDNATLVVLAARAKRLVGGVSVMALALLLIGCASPLSLAVRASDLASKAETTVAPTLEAQCVAPMRAIASQPAGPDRDTARTALDKACAPKTASYDGERRAHLIVIAQITSAEASGKYTPHDIAQAVSALATAVNAMIQEYVK